MRSLRKTALVLSLALAVAGCSDAEGPEGKKTPEAAPTASASAAPVVHGKEGWTGVVDPVHVRVEVGAVERYGERALLRFYVTNLGERPAFPDLTSSLAVRGEMSMRLLDPVGERAYFPLRDAAARQFGSETLLAPYQPGVRYEHVLLFPALPPDLSAVTVLTNTTAGEFTGVPVTDGAGTPQPNAEPVPQPASKAVSGRTYAFPMRAGNGEPEESGPVDMVGLTETEIQAVRRGPDGEEVGLRTDVLFAVDSAEPSARARGILDDVAAEIEARADVQLEITGHTDDTGTPAHNLALSRRRADTVLKELKARLGDGWKYRAKGVGETDPVVRGAGSGTAEARARDRRVEIAYALRPQEPAPAVNAPFHAEDGPVVASREADVDRLGFKTRRRIDVKPFYRDGAYLVAVFDITNLGPDPLSDTLTSYGGVNGGEFGEFTVIDPATRVRYGSVRLGPKSPVRSVFADPGETAFRVAPDTTNRGFFYVPAPPAATTSVTFDAGPFGTFNDIPIE
ncbi:OmpA family protein [Actinocorallia aurea]